MSRHDITDDEFAALFIKYGPSGVAALTGMDQRWIYRKRHSIEERLGIQLKAPDYRAKLHRGEGQYPTKMNFELLDGIALVGSDQHYWPDEISTAHRGFVHLGREFGSELKLVVFGGDGLDGARISRHPPIGWANPPSLIDELQEVEARTDEIREACKGAQFYWTIGNHDARFENKLALQNHEYAKVNGFMLKDHLPHWNFGWSLWVNSDVVVKHRFKGGVHATHNNTLWSGVTMLTGHLHSLKVTPFSDYKTLRWGVDCGTMADPYGPQFDYAEANPLNHRSGFIVLTFRKGVLLWPEIVYVLDRDHIVFRGQVIKV